MKPRTRIEPKYRKESILLIAANLASEVGYTNMTRATIAGRAKISEGLLTYYFKTIRNLKQEVLKYAIVNNIDSVIAQGLLLKDPLTLKLSPAIKKRVSQFLD